MKLRRIDVLINEETQERFNEGDIIKVKTIGTYSREYIGRLASIGTSELLVF